MKILVTGSGGQLGKEIEKKFKKHDLLLTDIDSFDIRNLEQTLRMVKTSKPDLIINCAALTAVDQCESDVDNAFLSNAIGPRNLAVAANEINCEIVHISTDYVFDGNGITNREGQIRPYNEFDITSPQSIYGQSKLAGENFIKELTNKYYIIRTAWLYGEGHNFVNTILNLSTQRDEIKVVNDQIGSPTSTVQLANMIDKLIGTKQYGLYHGTCEGSCSWFDFTNDIFRIKKINKKIIPVTSEEFIRPAKRPKYSVLENKMLKLNAAYTFCDWQEAIREYLLNQ